MSLFQQLMEEKYGVQSTAKNTATTPTFKPEQSVNIDEYLSNLPPSMRNIELASIRRVQQQQAQPVPAATAQPAQPTTSMADFRQLDQASNKQAPSLLRGIGASKIPSTFEKPVSLNLNADERKQSATETMKSFVPSGKGNLTKGIGTIDTVKAAWEYGKGTKLINEGYQEKMKSSDPTAGDDKIAEGMKLAQKNQAIIENEGHKFGEGNYLTETARAMVTPENWKVNMTSQMPLNLPLMAKSITAGLIGNIGRAAPFIGGTAGGVLGGTAGSLLPVAGTAAGAVGGAGAGTAAGLAVAGGATALQGKLIADVTMEEAKMEAAGVFQTILEEETQKGVSYAQAREKALKAAEKNYAANVAVIAGTNIGESLLIFGKPLKFLTEGEDAVKQAAKVGAKQTAINVAKTTAKETGKVAGTGLQEGGQELVQYGAQQWATEKPVDLASAEAKESFSAGFGMGGGMAAVGSVGSTVSELSLGKATKQTKAEVITNLPDQVMPQVMERVNEEIAKGNTPQDALNIVLDEIGNVEGLDTITGEAMQKEAKMQEIAKTNPAVLATSGQTVYDAYTGEALVINDDTLTDKFIVTNAKGQKGVIDREDATLNADVQTNKPSSQPGSIVYDKQGNALTVVDDTKPEFYVVEDEAQNRRLVAKDEVALDTPSNLTQEQQEQVGEEQIPTGETNVAPQAPQNESEEIMPVVQGEEVQGNISNDETEPVGESAPKEPWQMRLTEFRNNARKYVKVYGRPAEYQYSGGSRSQLINDSIDRKHRSFIEQALAEGKPVPEEVLKGYPDLVNKTGSKSTGESAPVEPKAKGKTATAKTERGTQINVQYALVNADDVIASHSTDLKANENYPQELQPRDRGRIASEMQIAKIVNNLEPEFLGENPKASEGAPIVGDDMVVESGNGRIIALKRVYEKGHANAAKYKQWLVDNAEKFGLSKADIDGMDKPVLVRVRTSEVNRADFVKEANEQSVAAMSATEQAISDAGRLSESLLELFRASEDGSILNEPNRNFIREFMGEVIGPTEQGRYVTSDGTISQEGVNRIRNAIFAKAYGDVTAIEKLAESTDNNIKAITNALLMLAPRFAKLKAAIEAGKFYPLDITPELANAAKKLSQLREERMSVESYLGQSSMFGEELDQLSKDVLRILDFNKRSAKKIFEVFGAYIDTVIQLGDPNQITMWDDGSPAPTKADLLDDIMQEIRAHERSKKNEPVTLFQNKPQGSTNVEKNNTGQQDNREAGRGVQEDNGAERKVNFKVDNDSYPTTKKTKATGMYWSEFDHKGKPDLAVVGSDKILKDGLTDFESWSASMLKDFGVEVENRLDVLWKKANGLANFITKKEAETQKRINRTGKDYTEKEDTPSGVTYESASKAERQKWYDEWKTVSSEAGDDNLQAGRSQNRERRGISDTTGDYSTNSPEFKAWFGDSKVVDENGEPLVVYHGTNGNFSVFSKKNAGAKTGNPTAGWGFFFTPSSAEASSYASDWQKEGGNIIPAYLSIKKPYIMPYLEYKQFTHLDNLKEGTAGLKRLANSAQQRKDELIKQGFDGIYVMQGNYNGKSITGEVGEIVAFSSEQVKSVYNAGTWDATNPDIRFKSDSVTAIAKDLNLTPAPEAMEQEIFQAANTLSQIFTGNDIVTFKGKGIQGMADGDTIYLNQDAKDPVLYVAKHEIVHTLETTDPVAYKRLMNLVRRYFTGNPEMLKHYQKQKYTEAEAWGEFTSDVISEVMEQPNFWQMVREKAPKVIKAVVDVIDQIISKFKKAVAKDDSMLKYIDDLEAFKAEVAGVVAESLSKPKRRNILDLRTDGEVAAKAKTGSIKNSKGDKINPTGNTNRLGDKMGNTSIDDIKAIEAEETQFSIRKGEPPKKTVTGYKLMRKGKDGKLYPLFVDRNKETPIGVWLDAKEGELKIDPKTGTKKVKSSLGDLAFRPGWHLGDIPLATHIGIKGPSGNIEYMNPDHVWVEVEAAADVNYQEEANANGVNSKTGRLNKARADIKHIPIDGYYRYKTNPNMTGEWVITGSMKLNRVLSDEEAAKIVREAGYEPLPRKPIRYKRNLLDGIGTAKREGKKEVKFKRFILPSEEVQERMEKSRGVKPETTKAKLQDALADIARKGHREFEYLPRTGRFSELRNALLKFRKQKGVAADTTLRILKDVTDGLSEYEYDIFTYKVIFDDLAHDFDAEMNLPFGLTTDNFAENKAKVDEEAENNPKVIEAIEKRREAWQGVKDDYIAAQKAVGFKVEDRLQKEDYYRHQVLEYANAKSLLGTGKKLKTPTGRGFLKQREGSTFDINTDYLQAEYEVMAQMIYDSEIAKVVRVVKENYDIVNQLKKQAIEQNNEGMLQYFQSVIDEYGVEGPADKLFRKTLNKKQAIAFSQLYKMAAMGELPAGPNNKYEKVIQEMADAHYGNIDEAESLFDGEQTFKGELFSYLNYLSNQTESVEGQIKARTVYKGMAEKQRMIKNTLGKSFVTWEDLIPEGYSLWQPRDGHMFYMVNSIPEGLAQQLMEGIAEEVGIDKSVIKRVMVMGQNYPELVVPDEVALTLENLYKDLKEESPLSKGYHGLYRFWKQWQLISPRRYFKYNARNMTGDFDAVLAGNPSSMKKIPEAWQDLWQAFFAKDKVYTPELYEWFKRGGFETLMQAQEINDINRNREFAHLMESRLKKTPMETIINLPKAGWLKYWDTVRTTTDFREALLRYASFLDYREQLQNNNGVPKNWGASNRDEIMGIKDWDDRAAKLANELLGAYDEVSVIGTALADNFLPFWRWNEVNFVRYSRLFKNAYQDGKLMGAVAGKASGMLIRSPLIAWKVGIFVIKASALLGMITAWNLLFFGDEEDDLPKDVRERLHIILGRDADGKVIYFSRLGAFQDFLDWFGVDTPVQTVRDFLNGRRTIKEIAIDIAKEDANKVINAITPFIKNFTELLLGQKMYPDAFKPQRIRDRWQYLADSFGLGNEYKALADKPTKGYEKSLADLLVYRADPYESAYWGTLDEKRRFLKEIGQSSDGYSTSPRSEALYNVKLAIRYGDRKAYEKYLLEYAAKGGTAKGLKQSLNAMNPLYGLDDAEKRAFVQYLDTEGKEDLVKAMEYYNLVIGGGTFNND